MRELPDNSPLVIPTIQESIADRLRNLILTRHLRPGERLVQSELAEQLGVSRTPIKEVLLTLHAEEWIMRQGSHFIVTPLSLERIREITEIAAAERRKVAQALAAQP